MTVCANKRGSINFLVHCRQWVLCVKSVSCDWFHWSAALVKQYLWQKRSLYSNIVISHQHINVIGACENTMYYYGLAYHVCNRILHTFHILSLCDQPFVLFTVSLVSWCCTTHRTVVDRHFTPKPHLQACQPLTAQPNPNGVNSTPPQSGPDNFCLFLQSRSAHTKRPTIGLGWMC